MRHYFGYDLDGILRSYESYGPAGWPSAYCLEDHECQEAAVTSLREMRANQSPEIINWVVYNCPCDPAQGALLRNCACAPTKFSESVVDTATKSLRPKLLRTVYIDDQVVQDHDIITAEPATSVRLKVVSVGAPDGSTIKCAQRGAVDVVLEDEWEMTFTSGQTEEKILVAPAQGTKGYVTVGGGLARPLTFGLRGFVSA